MLPENALKEALGFSLKGDVRPISSLPVTREGKAKRVFHKKIRIVVLYHNQKAII